MRLNEGMRNKCAEVKWLAGGGNSRGATSGWMRNSRLWKGLWKCTLDPVILDNMLHCHHHNTKLGKNLTEEWCSSLQYRWGMYDKERKCCSGGLRWTSTFPRNLILFFLFICHPSEGWKESVLFIWLCLWLALSFRWPTYLRNVPYYNKFHWGGDFDLSRVWVQSQKTQLYKKCYQWSITAKDLI